MPKRKRVVLTIEKKLEIIEALRKGEPGRSLSERYGVGTATISEIGKNAAAIVEYSRKLEEEGGSSQRKSMKGSHNAEVMEAVYVWFVQKRAAGTPVSGDIIREKALCFNEQMNGDPNFKASQGWLQKFVKRHGIRSFRTQGEKLSADQSAAGSFKQELKEFLDREQFDEDFVYNADETGWCWKALPTKSFVTHVEGSAPGFKALKDRVTLMVCANSSGSHRIPLFLIGKSKAPRAFKGVKKLPVIYGHQKRAWMNTDRFMHWFQKVFIPETRSYQKSIGKSGKVLLLLDNAPAHPSPDQLDSLDERVTVKFLPPNVTSLVQPMDQGVIRNLKFLYRKRLLGHLLLSDSDAVQSVPDFYKMVSLKDCCYLAAESWEMVKQSTLRNAWNEILISRRTVAASVDNDEDNDITGMIQKLKSLSLCGECAEPDVHRWLTCDSNEEELQPMSDEEIIEFVSKEPAGNEEEQQADEDEGERSAVPTHNEAFVQLEAALLWFEDQEECDARRLLCLKSIRDLAASKRRSTLKQALITDYLK